MSSSTIGGRDSALSFCSSSSQPPYSASTYPSHPRGPEPSVDGASYGRADGMSPPWNSAHRRAIDGAPAASPSFPRTRSTLAGFDFFTHAGDAGTAAGSLLPSTALGGGAGHRESFAVLAQRKNPLGAFDLSRNHEPTSCRPHVFHLDPLHDLEDDLPRQRAGAHGGKSAGGPWQPPKIGVLVRSSSSMSSPPNRLPRIESPAASSPSRAASTIEGRLGLRTGEDCVLFFGTAGHSKHGLRCIFLLRAPNPKTRFRPYDLVVAQSHEISSEYFTMTPDGVTHVRPGMPSKFTALADFMRESSLFNALAALPFMRTFYLAKAHARLFNSVRKSAFERSLQSVQSLSMYTCTCYGSDSFGQVLRRTAAICHLIQQVVLFDCKEIRHSRSAVDFSDFTNSQHAVLEAGVQRLRELAAQAVDVVANFAREAEGLKVRPLEGQIGDMVPGTEPTVIGFRGLKHKGMVQLKVDRQASDQKLANIRRNIERTSDLARACDYMICASLLAIARAAVAEIDHLMANPPKKFGYFSILLCLGPQPRAIDMSPNLDDLSNGLKAIDNAMCSSLNALPRVLHGKEYAHLIPREFIGLVLPQVFESDFPMLSCRRSCDAVLANNFARGAEFAKDFAELWAIKLHTSSFDLARGLREDCASDSRTVELLNSAKFIKRELQMLKKFTADLDRKKMSSHVGTLQVEGRILRANLSASISGCMEVIRRELHETARASCAHALAEFTTHLKALQRRPNSLKEFAAFLDVKSEITADVRNLYQLSAAVDEMYRVMNSIEVRVSAAEHVKLDDLHSVHGKVVETLSNADSDCASRMPVMSQALDKSVAALNDELLNMLTSLHTGIYDNPESSTKVVLRELSICNENIDAVQEKTKLYARYQMAFKISPYDFSYLKTVREFCLDRIDVWSKLDSFRSSIAKIYDTAFDASVASAFRALMEQTGVAAAAAMKKNDADKIAVKYMAEFKLHAAYSDIIEALGNNAMRPSHWKKIYGIIGMSVVDERLPKFRELQKYKLEAAATAIMDVSACATGEHVLRKQMEEIESKLPLWTLEFSDEGTVTNFEALGIDIEAAAMTLKGMGLSRFCDVLGDRMQSVAASVEVYLRVVRNMDVLQRLWLMLRGVMESSEAAVIMPDEHASFARVNGAWKELLLRASKRSPQVHALISSKDSVGFEARLIDHMAVLEKCLLKLDQFVDIKCQSFPRLLLLERAEVIRLLSYGPISRENVEYFQAAVRVCFPGVEQLLFQVRSDKDGGAWLVKGVQPVNARCILLNTQVVAGAIDKWLKDTLNICRETLQSATDDAVSEHCKANEDVWMLQRPKQCVELALKVIMHQTIESLLLQRQDGSAGSTQALDALATQCDVSCKERSRLLNGNALPAADQRTVVSCVFIGMHFRDVLHHLHHSNCAAVDDFAWVSMMRMTWLQADSSSASTYVMKVFDYDVPYGFDVNPGDSDHVTTPQTARFNLGVLSAVRAMCCCHALCGPSGCGKTSLIRNLAASLGRSFVSADVHANVSVDRMPHLLTAAASSLVWIALDHVHKWSPELLSSFSQSLLSALDAIRSSASFADVLGTESRSARPDAARAGVLFFLTAPEAYFPSASSSISSAVSKNFRPSQVTMPDVFAVAEAFFVVNGFDSAKEIAKKMHHLYTEWNALLPLPCHQLSINIVEAVASAARRIAGGCSASPARDIECTGVAVRLVVMPRCPPELLILVEPLVQLLFPSPAAALQWPLQAEAVKSAFAMAQMIWCEGMGATAAHLCSVLQVSTAVVVVGSCCSGKSSLIAIASAHSSSRTPAVEMTSIDPLCCVSQLFTFCSASGAVSDGIVNVILNGSAESPAKSSRRWLHCDGDMTSASEMLLSHARVREVLQQDPCASFDRIVFETDNLHQASPSLLGTLSVVYCPVGMLPHKILLEDMVKSLKFPGKTAQQQIAELLLALLPRVLESLFPKGCGSVEAHWLQHRQLMINVVQLIASMFTSQACDMPSSSCAKLFTFCVFWGLAGGIGRRMWDEASSCYVEGDLLMRSLGARVRSVCCTAAMLPPVGDAEELHEYCVSEGGDWCRWDSVLASPMPLRGAAIYVQTSRTAPCLQILTSLAAQGRHAALIGGRGSGKSVLVDALTAKLSDASPPSASSVVFSVATFRTLSSNNSAPAPALESFLRNHLHLSEAGCYVPERCVNLVVAVDDISSCPPSARPSLNAALRQFFGSCPVGSRSALGVMYDPQKCGLVHRITGTSVLVTASSSDLISPRVARYLAAVHLAAPSESHLIRVFEAVAAAAFSACAPDVRVHIVKLASVTASVYHQTLHIAASAAATFFPLPHPSDCLKVIHGCAVSGSVNTGTTRALHRVWLHEMCRVFRDRFSSLGCGEFDRVFKGVCSSLLETQVTDANIYQLWTRFLSLDGVYAPVSNLDLVTDLLHSRLSEFHKKHKERISLVLDRSSVTAVASVARVLQQPSGHCALLNYNHAVSRALCFFSGFVSDFNVVEMPAIDSAAAGTAFLRAVAVQCIEHNTRIALIIKEEALVFDPVLELVAALTHGGASAVLDRPALLHLAHRVSTSLPVSGLSTLQLIENFASEAMQRNLKIIVLGSSSPASPIARLPHVASSFTFHACTLPQTAFFSAALQASLGSGFADFSVCGVRADAIAETFEALRDVVLFEAERAHLSGAVKQKLADGECCMHAVQVFCTDSTEKTETLASSIYMAQTVISVFSNLVKDAECLMLKMQLLNQQIDHARMAHQDIAAVCRELEAATACASRPPLETRKARTQLLSFADHLLVDCLSGSHVSFADNVGEALLLLLDVASDEMYGLPQDYFRGSGALTRIKDALKSKGCVAQPDSLSSFWILEGISRHAALKQESVLRLQSVLLRSNVQAVYNSSHGTVEEVMEDFDKCMVEFLVSVHDFEREQGLQNSREFLEAAVQKEIDTRNTLDECALVHASLTKMCDTLKPLVEKWKTDVEAKQLQQGRIVGDALQNAVQLVWGVVFAPEHRQELAKRCSECLSIHGIDATDSIMEFNSGFMPSPLPVNAYERLAVCSLTRKDIGIEWTLLCDPDERLPRIIELYAQCKDGKMIMSSVRSDDPSLEGALERSVSDGRFLIVHVVQPDVPVILLELVRTRSLKVYGRPYLRIGSRMFEMHRNFKIVMRLSTLKFDNVPALLSACRAVDLTLHADYLEQHVAAAIAFGMHRESETTQTSTPRAELSSEAVLQSEHGIMRAINNPSLRSPSLDLEMIESINEMLGAHLVLQEEIKQQKQHLEQLPAASESHVGVAKAAAQMLRSLRAMSSIQPDAGCSVPMLLDICHHIVHSLKLNVGESSPALFNMLSHHMDPVPRLIFALLFSCARDPLFMAPELVFLHSPIGLNVSPAIEGYEHPGTRALDWLPLDTWARVAALTVLPGVGVDVLKSMRSCADAWKKWYLSIDKGMLEQFPDGFSKKLTPLQCACLARCFGEHLMRPSLQMYVARTLSSAYDESRFDPLSIIKTGVPAPIVIKETEGLHALSAVQEMREQLHRDSSVVCVVADGTNWRGLVSKVCDNLSAGRWVVVCCMTSLPWDTFEQLHDGAAKYYKASLARLFIVLCAFGHLPRDASAMCLHLNASLSTAPSALFETMYAHLLPVSLPRSQRNMSVAEAFKHLGCSRLAVFQLVCAAVLSAQRDIQVKSYLSFDLRNRAFIKALGARCASAANALFRHSREFPVANLPKGYTYAAVDDVLREALEELSDWAPAAAVSSFIRSLSSLLGSSAPPPALQEQGGSDLTQYMSSFCWPSTLQTLKVDVAQLVYAQGRDSSQLQLRLQAVPCIYPCRSIPFVPFDCSQIHMLLELLPSERDLHLQLDQPHNSAGGDCMAACVSSMASLSMTEVCRMIVQMRMLIAAAIGYCQGLVSASELVSCARSVSYFCSISPDFFSIFTPVGIVNLRAAIQQRLLPQFEALKSASSCVQSGVSLGAFHVPVRLLSAARAHAARNLRIPLESVRVQASVVAGLDAIGAPLLAVCDVSARNAILTTSKGNDCDTLMFGSQSLNPLPLSFLFLSDASAGKVANDAAAGAAITKVVKVPMMLQGSSSQPEAVFLREISLVGVRLDGIDPAQLVAENVYLAVRGY